MKKETLQLNPTTYNVVPNNNPKDRIEVEIGDSKQTDFYPQLKIMRWDNEVNLSVRLIDDNAGSLIKEGEKIIYDKPDRKIEFYEGDNCHKMVWFLKEKPATNKVEFTIQSKGLDFFYQPELTQKEKDEGCVRPENVVGSYAVYSETHKTNWVGGTKYKVGKIGHIYRPHLYDSNGLEAWGILHIENGIYSVEIPQEFLDKAVYPIKSNDDFGYTTKGVYSTSGWSNYQQGTFDDALAGTVTAITGVIKQNSSTPYEGYVKYAIYTKRGVSGRPETKILESEELSFIGDSAVNTRTWQEASVSSGAIDAGTYWIIKGGNKVSGQSDIGTLCFDNDFEGTAAGGEENGYVYANLWPETWTDNSSYWDLRTDRQYSIYATYTPSGGGTTENATFFGSNF